ncbi:MAG: insulinase family protein [Holophaga sp.]|nr:insulinase family protein [Holophaga sp.]
MRLTSLIATLIALPMLAQAPQGSLDKLPDPRKMSAPKLQAPQPKVQSFSLANGVRVLFIEDHELPVVEMYAAFKAGSLEDPADKAGLAAMAANLLRTGGTKSFTSDQLNEKLENLAADVEFGASAENSGGGIHCFKADAANVLTIFAEMLRAPRFAADRIEFLRNQTLSRLKQQEDQPVQLAVQGMRRLIFNGKGQGNPPTQATVKAITEQDLRTFASTWFVPNNMVLGLSGDLTLAEAKTLLKKTLGDWPKAKLPALARTSEPTQAAPGIYVRKKDKVNQSVVLAGMIGYRDTDPDRVALGAAFTVLGEGEMGSRLFNTIRTKNALAYQAGSFSNFTNSVDGMFIGYAITKGESTTKAARLLREECIKLAKEGITSEEWENAKRALTNKEVFANATSSAVIATAVGLALFDQPLDTRAKRLEKLQTLDLAQVNEAVRRRFKPEDLRLYILGDPAGFGEDKPESLGKVTEVSK